MLAERVAAGELPPVDERLPDVPDVIEPTARDRHLRRHHPAHLQPAGIVGRRDAVLACVRDRALHSCAIGLLSRPGARLGRRRRRQESHAEHQAGPEVVRRRALRRRGLPLHVGGHSQARPQLADPLLQHRQLRRRHGHHRDRRPHGALRLGRRELRQADLLLALGRLVRQPAAHLPGGAHPQAMAHRLQRQGRRRGQGRGIRELDPVDRVEADPQRHHDPRRAHHGPLLRQGAAGRRPSAGAQPLLLPGRQRRAAAPLHRLRPRHLPRRQRVAGAGRDRRRGRLLGQPPGLDRGLPGVQGERGQGRLQRLPARLRQAGQHQHPHQRHLRPGGRRCFPDRAVPDQGVPPGAVAGHQPPGDRGRRVPRQRRTGAADLQPHGEQLQGGVAPVLRRIRPRPGQHAARRHRTDRPATATASGCGRTAPSWKSCSRCRSSWRPTWRPAS